MKRKVSTTWDDQTAGRLLVLQDATACCLCPCLVLHDDPGFQRTQFAASQRDSCRRPSEQSRVGGVPASSMPALLVVASKHHANT